MCLKSLKGAKQQPPSCFPLSLSLCVLLLPPNPTSRIYHAFIRKDHIGAWIFSLTHEPWHDAIGFTVVFACIRGMCVDERWQVFSNSARPLLHTGVISPLETLGSWPTCKYNKLNVEKTALIMSLGGLRQWTVMHKQENCRNTGSWKLSLFPLTRLLFSFSCCRLDLLARLLKGGHCVPDSSYSQYFKWILLFSVEPLTLCLDYLTLLC